MPDKKEITADEIVNLLQGCQKDLRNIGNSYLADKAIQLSEIIAYIKSEPERQAEARKDEREKVIQEILDLIPNKCSQQTKALATKIEELREVK